jgi:hypothetical protein
VVEQLRVMTFEENLGYERTRPKEKEERPQGT